MRLDAWVVPSFPDVFFVACLALALVTGSRMVNGDGDPARHLTVGGYILSSGHVPTDNVFSYTRAGEPLLPYEWLARVAAAASHRLAGLGGVVLLHGLAIGLAFVVVLRHIVARGQSARLARWVVAFAIVTSTVHWIARPHVFTYLGLAVFAAVLDGWYAGRISSRVLWLLPLGMVLWVNLHGGFFIGILLLGSYVLADFLRLTFADGPAMSETRRRLRVLIPVSFAAILATIVNPAGLGMLTHGPGLLGQRLVIDRTVEFRSPDFHQAALIPFLAMLLGTMLVTAWSRWRPTIQEGLLLAVFTALSFYSGRNIPLFAIVVAPLLASALSSMPLPNGGLFAAGRPLGQCLTHATAGPHEPPLERRGHLWPMAAAAVLFVIGAVQAKEGEATLGVDFDPSLQPVAAASYLKGHQPLGNGFNELIWGGYLLHELWPVDRVFIDGQTDFYGEAIFRDYLDVADLQENWQEVLDRYGVRWFIYETGSPVTRALKNAGWHVAYEDPMATVLTR